MANFKKHTLIPRTAGNAHTSNLVKEVTCPLRTHLSACFDASSSLRYRRILWVGLRERPRGRCRSRPEVRSPRPSPPVGGSPAGQTSTRTVRAGIPVQHVAIVHRGNARIRSQGRYRGTHETFIYEYEQSRKKTLANTLRSLH